MNVVHTLYIQIQASYKKKQTKRKVAQFMVDIVVEQFILKVDLAILETMIVYLEHHNQKNV